MARVMAWAMRDWRRVWYLNTFPAGNSCRAGVAATEPKDADDHTVAGGSGQRFWLTATPSGYNMSQR
jgi:hypothetical protein